MLFSPISPFLCREGSPSPPLVFSTFLRMDINSYPLLSSFFPFTKIILRENIFHFWKQKSAPAAEQLSITLLAGWYSWRIALWNLNLQWILFSRYIITHLADMLTLSFFIYFLITKLFFSKLKVVLKPCKNQFIF